MIDHCIAFRIHDTLNLHSGIEQREDHLGLNESFYVRVLSYCAMGFSEPSYYH